MLWTTGPRVSIDIINYPSSKQRKCRSDCVDVQADLHFWCWCIALTGFLMTWLKWAITWQNQQNECASSETQISLGISPVWSVFTVRMYKLWVLSYPLSAQRRLWSVWADAQADLSHSEDSDQSGRMPRLIWVFAGCTLTLLVLSCRSSDVLVCKQTLTNGLNPHMPYELIHP